MPSLHIRREDAERITCSGQHLVARMHAGILEVPKLDTASRGHRSKPPLALPSMRVGIAVEKYCFRLCLDQKFFKLCDRIPLPHNKPASDGPEIFVQRSQATAEEMLAVGTGPAVRPLPMAQHIHGDHAFRLLRCRAQSGVVCQAQVSSEPVDCPPHAGRLRGKERLGSCFYPQIKDMILG